MTIKRIDKLLLFFLFFFSCMTPVVATSGNLFVDNTTLKIGEEKEITLSLNNIVGTVVGAEGEISLSDSSCVSVTSYNGVGSVIMTGSKFSFIDIMSTGVSGKTNLVKIKIKGIKNCSTSLQVNNGKIYDDQNNIIPISLLNNTINVVKEASENNYLSNLKINDISLNPNFDKIISEYNVSVTSKTINIIATPEDSKSIVLGSGEHSLDFGDNYITIIVKSESNAERKYRINVTRINNNVEKSKDNNLKSLEIKGFEITPVFNTSISLYSLKVPNNIDFIEVIATPTDNKSIISINGNQALVVGKNNKVVIDVTSESGDKKSYTVVAYRETLTKLEPVPSNDNTLSSIETSEGILSPTFSKEIMEYELILQKDIQSYAVEGILSNKNSSLKKEIDGNKIKFIVTSESGQERIYVVDIIKENLEVITTNPYLRTISITNGSKINFNKNTYYYEVTKYENFSISYEPDDERSIVEKREYKNDLFLIVKAIDDSTKTYHIKFVEKSVTNLSIFVLVMELIIIVTISTIYIRKRKHTKKSPKIRKVRARKIKLIK